MKVPFIRIYFANLFRNLIKNCKPLQTEIGSCNYFKSLFHVNDEHLRESALFTANFKIFILLENSFEFTLKFCCCFSTKIFGIWRENIFIFKFWNNTSCIYCIEYSYSILIYSFVKWRDQITILNVLKFRFWKEKESNTNATYLITHYIR